MDAVYQRRLQRVDFVTRSMRPTLTLFECFGEKDPHYGFEIRSSGSSEEAPYVIQQNYGATVSPSLVVPFVQAASRWARRQSLKAGPLKV